MTPPAGLTPTSASPPLALPPVGTSTVAPAPRPEAQEELQSSRLSNFLSDDISAEGRDSDPTRSGRSFVPATTTEQNVAPSLHDESAPPPPQEQAANDDIPAPLRSETQIVAASPVEAAVRSILDQQSGDSTVDDVSPVLSEARNLKAVAQYSNVQDVLTRLSA